MNADQAFLLGWAGFWILFFIGMWVWYKHD